MGKGLLDTLYEDCEGFLELRAFHPKKKGQKDGIRRAFFKANDFDSIGKFIKQNRAYDCYFGVATRDSEGGGKENILEIPAVFIDIDFKQVDEQEALRLLNDFPLPPTIIIRSGGGLHVYWKLEEPATLEDKERIENILWGLASVLKGDFASAEIARILRVPKTLNYKYIPPRPVKISHCNGTTYNPSDFDFLPEPDRSGYKPDTKKDGRENIKRIMQCAFMQHCRDHAKQLEEPLWFSMITQLAKEPGGVSMIHKLSKPYPKYSAKETDAKILHAIDSTGPHSCDTIRRLWDCGKSCGVGAPAALAFRVPVEDYACPSEDAPNATSATNAPNATHAPGCNQNATKHATRMQPSTKPAGVPPIDKVREWLSFTEGAFHYTEMARELQFISINTLKSILKRLVDSNVLERVGSRSGTYQKIDTSFQEMELFGDTPEEYPFTLPLGLTNVAVLQEGNLIVFAGDTNAAKTAVVLEACRLNLHNSKIRYINSEMGTTELNNRLSKYKNIMPLEAWKKVQFGIATSNFHHYVLPDDVTVIDYIDIHEEFYRLGGIFQKIHQKLDKGICLAAIQKRKGSPVGKGGDATMEKCRLYVTLSRIEQPGIEPFTMARIAKCKHSRREDLNANGLVRSFRVIRSGTEFDYLNNWHRPNEQEQKLLFTR